VPRPASSVSGAVQALPDVLLNVTVGAGAPAAGAVGDVLKTTRTESARNAAGGSNVAHAEFCARAAEGGSSTATATEVKMIHRMDTSLLSHRWATRTVMPPLQGATPETSVD